MCASLKKSRELINKTESLLRDYMQYETATPGGSIDADYSVRKLGKRRTRLINKRRNKPIERGRRRGRAIYRGHIKVREAHFRKQKEWKDDLVNEGRNGENGD